MTKKALIIGASRGIGLGVVKELLAAGWAVTGTVRQPSGTELHALASDSLSIAQLDTTNRAQLDALSQTLPDDYDLILVNAGVASGPEPISDTPLTDFARVLEVNAYAPAVAIEQLTGHIAPTGTLAVTTSRMGSIADNGTGGSVVYRASKAALNQLLKSYSATHPDLSLVLVHPGWVKTDFSPGTANAPLSVTQSATGIVAMLTAHLGEPGIQFRDYKDDIIPW